MTKRIKAVTLAEPQDALETMVTTSSKIRYLASTGMTKSQIAAKLNIRYQHVRNVLITPLKKA